MADEFEITGQSRERAQILSNEIARYIDRQPENEVFAQRPFSRERDGVLDRIGREIAGETPVADVVADAVSFNRHIVLARAFDLPIPVAELPGIGQVPVLNPALGQQLHADFPWSSRSVVREWWRAQYNLVPGVEGPIANPTQALRGFQLGLVAFLGFRFEGFSFWLRSRGNNFASGSGIPPAGTAAPGKSGFHITLDCNHQHLAAYASPAYALTWRNLGSFTKPATGILPPGTWIFGASGPPLTKFEYDPLPVYVPPTFTPATTCF